MVSPRNSAAWPVSLNTVRIEGLPSRSRMVEIALANPVAGIVKLVTATDRIALPLVAVVLLLHLSTYLMVTLMKYLKITGTFMIAVI